MIRFSLFPVDDNQKMMGRITAPDLIRPEDFDPEWVNTKDMMDMVMGQLKPTDGIPARVLGLIENVKAFTVAPPVPVRETD